MGDASSHLEDPVGKKDASAIKKKIDKNGDDKVDKAEFYEGLGGCKSCKDDFAADGVTLPEFKKRGKATHKTPKKMFEAFSGGKPTISKKAFAKAAKKLKPEVPEDDSEDLI